MFTTALDDLTEDDCRIKGEIFIMQANIPAIMDELEKIMAQRGRRQRPGDRQTGR